MNANSTLERDIGYRFRDSSLLEKALTHRSAGNWNNERLEYLGDSILGFCVAEMLFHRFPDAREGDMTRMRARLVRGKTLAELARSLDLQIHVKTGPGERKSGGFNRDSILADTFEAIVGAVYLDSGFENVSKVLLGLYEKRLTEISPDNVKDNKSRLQEQTYRLFGELPEYSVLDQSGSEHSPVFRVVCRVNGMQAEFFAEGKSRKQAEQKAAAQALEALNT